MNAAHKFDRNKTQPQNFVRMNLNIRVPQVRVIGPNGEKLGVMNTDAARKMAVDQEMDLIETVPHANPPVCTITSFGKYRYEEKLKQKEEKRKQRESVIELKEIRFHPGIAEHDLDTKIKHITDFLNDKKNVQVKLEFRKREIAHKEEGWAVINKVVEKVGELAHLSMKPRMEGKFITCRFDVK